MVTYTSYVDMTTNTRETEMNQIKQAIAEYKKFLKSKSFPYAGAEKQAWIDANLAPLVAAVKGK
jgi:hypothetical protein